MDDFPDLTGKTILQVAPELSAGGVERTVLDMTEAIVAAGGRALLASRGGRLEDEFAALGGELFPMNAKSKNPLVLKLNAAKLKNLIFREGVDLIHARSRAPAWSAYWAAKGRGLPFVTTYHGAYSGTTKLKRRYNSVMARGDIVIANSNWIAAHVQAEHGLAADRIVTIPRGVDLSKFDPVLVPPSRIEAVRARWGLAGDPRLTLFLPGRLTEWKGQLLVIEAIALMAMQEQKGLVVVMAGDPQGRAGYVTQLEDAILAHKLGGTVILAEHERDMPAACLAADIVLMPSVRPEAFGRVAAEASAMGRPVIVSDHGGGRETVIEGETGARAEPGNPAALAGAIRALVAIGPDARAGMGKAGQAFVSAHFSKRGLQAATLHVYKRLLR
ncbi:glycosyltransferase family 4 protein [Hyphomonas johnsonii]|uniref:Glycosyl transferase family protein n=1 Tax=Hyphomonas johnsonii MHS-2 TaxID=1280950 RepID=A0A059FQ39_9PROT|nr:glycosyltransferase family 4 protein [Hyphomonas johnsonii]KCZ92779.1 glycosyl transferase family protein [Hyphomonas johnsonii MHS-2]